MQAKLEKQQILDAHRYFAIECNNKAWSIAEGSDAITRGDELLDLAHASAFHWQIVGADLERMRAMMLLANVHALLGMGASAMRYAQRVRSFFLAQSAVADWELAFVHTVHARACASVGDAPAHLDSYAKAQAAISAITDPEDKAIVLITFEQVPSPS